jgi:hypothetical protein
MELNFFGKVSIREIISIHQEKTYTNKRSSNTCTKQVFLMNHARDIEWDQKSVLEVILDDESDVGNGQQEQSQIKETSVVFLAALFFHWSFLGVSWSAIQN